MNSNLMRDLLDLGDAFEQDHPDQAEQTVPNFLAWCDRTQSIKMVSPTANALKDPAHTYYADNVPVLQTFIAQYVVRAYRYARLYVKKALEQVPLLGFDDFIALATLAGYSSMTKGELVEVTLNEKTSGMLVIKRLIDNGFITQLDDAQDKRTRRVMISDKGMATLQTVQPAMNEATGLIVGDLSQDEQRQLSTLLTRLDKFHEPVYRADRDLPLDQLKDVVNNIPK